MGSSINDVISISKHLALFSHLFCNSCLSSLFYSSSWDWIAYSVLFKVLSFQFYRPTKRPRACQKRKSYCGLVSICQLNQKLECGQRTIDISRGLLVVDFLNDKPTVPCRLNQLFRILWSKVGLVWLRITLIKVVLCYSSWHCQTDTCQGFPKRYCMTF